MSTTQTAGALTLKNQATYLWALAFVAGNVIFPQVCHYLPWGGKALLPIMLFTMIAAVRFGTTCAVLTALVSPAVSSLLFGMPSGVMLVAVLTKSLVIALVFGLWKQRVGHFSALTLLMLALFVQSICFVLEGAFMFGFATSWADLLISYPGVILQVGMSMLVLKYWK